MPEIAKEGPDEDAVEARIEALLGEMTLAEKLAMTAGSDAWHSTGVARLGIPAFKMTDGPHGARGEAASDQTSAAFPVGTAMGATWNLDLLAEIGRALAAEARAKGAQVLLAPTVNIHRTPLAGRNFECYSEDPYLSGRMAVAMISALQGEGVAACIKHFVCNDSEFERHTISSDVDERALREIYLRPFEMAVTDAGPWALMSAYNRVNGVHAAQNNRLLDDILRGEWGWRGAVISDWFGVYDGLPTANAGLDLEMPGPGRHLGEGLERAIEDGLVSPERIDAKVRNLLRLAFRTGRMAMDTEPKEQSIDDPAHHALLRRVAGEGMVLLKNEGGLLPIDPARVKKIAVIGPNAARSTVMGGGSSGVTPHYVVHALDGIENRFGPAAEIRHGRGCFNHRMIPEIERGQIADIRLDYFDDPDCAGAPVHSEDTRSMGRRFRGEIPGLSDQRRFSCRFTGRFVPRVSGPHLFSVTASGLGRLFVGGALLVDNWTAPEPGDWLYGNGSREAMAEIEMTAGRAYEIRAEYRREENRVPALRLGLLEPVAKDPGAEAERLARWADLVILVAGTTAEWETEGRDRESLNLPGEQDALIARAAAANPRTVVVLNTGSPHAMPWADGVPAILQAWFGGQEFGNALADILSGDRNPSGRLTTTFPARIEDMPAFPNYPGEAGHVRYEEGIFVGYRGYEARGIKPLFPFGHGLGYTDFAYSELRAAADGEGGATVSLTLANEGQRAGQEVVQIYVAPVSPTIPRPEKELKAFAKIELAPGETREVTLALDPRAFSYYHADEGRWIREPGAYEILAGASSADIRLSARLEITEIKLRGITGT